MVIAAIVVVVLVEGGGGPKRRAAAPPVTARARVSASPSVARDPLAAGVCFDAPGLSGVSRITVRSCRVAHDAESVGHFPLPAGLSTIGKVYAAGERVCEKPINSAYARQHRASGLFPYRHYPTLAEYRSGQHQVLCALAASDAPHGAKLDAPLR
ncbi:hypothetical protein [Phaeacidiphilus oryzae]|uniref:hypothetical protein n=1 Tax=Phaeacidiphilus oryzae TaxID=348818 RepID=UPI00055B67DC|nr:hypothetical protein [Phaeacidiphilus oryzae]